MKLAQQIEREKEEQRRAEAAAAALARKIRPKTQKEIDQMRSLWSAAKALAVSQGRKEASFADLHECRGVPRQGPPRLVETEGLTFFYCA
jgi:hypothetical protein